jgi:hypothetical protein
MKFIPNDAYIDECIKILQRFLKEKGRYWQMMNYLFKNGRGKRQFYKDVRKLYDRDYDFRDVLHIAYTLGPADRILGLRYWEKNIKYLSDDFKIYFIENMYKIKTPLVYT